jgi:RNA polymerase sigma factor (sigma-70 family)
MFLAEDRDLLTRFRAGEGAAMRQVFEHYAPGIAALLRRGFGFQTSGNRRVQFRGLRETFDLEDLLQEVFRRAFAVRARSNYDGLRSYKAYLGAIARNVVIDTYQANARRLERYGFEEIESTAQEQDWSAADDALCDTGETSVSGNPELDAETRELRRLVERFRGTLREREAEVFRLRFGQRLTHDAVAERTGLSPSKIKTAEGRIRKAMLKFMHRHGYLSHLRSSQLRSSQREVRGESS